MRWDAYRTGQIGANFKWCHPGSQRRCRAATGTARRALDIPGVISAAKERIVGLKIGQQHRHVRFADENAARGLEACGHGAICLGHVVGQWWEPGCGAHARRRMGIFQRKGHAMQRPPHLTASQCVIRFPRPFMCLLGIHSDDGIQSRIVFINLRQMRFQHFCG